MDLLFALVEPAAAIGKVCKLLGGTHLGGAKPLQLALDFTDQLQDILVGSHRLVGQRRRRHGFPHGICHVATAGHRELVAGFLLRVGG